MRAIAGAAGLACIVGSSACRPQATPAVSAAAAAAEQDQPSTPPAPAAPVAAPPATTLIESGPQRPPTWAVPLDHPGLPNLHRVSDVLYRGAQPTDEGFAELARMGVKTVVNLRTFHSDRQACERYGLRYISINAQAWEGEDDEVIDFLRAAADPLHQPVFVHCQHGADRTGVMCAAWRMAVENWSREETLKEMTDGGYGFHAVWTNLVGYVAALDAARIRRAAGLDQADVAAVSMSPENANSR